MTIGSVDEILDFAIDREQQAHDFYVDLAKRAERPGMEDLFTQFAREELGHKKKLEGIKAGNRSFPIAKDVPDLKLGDHLIDSSRPIDAQQHSSFSVVIDNGRRLSAIGGQTLLDGLGLVIVPLVELAAATVADSVLFRRNKDKIEDRSALPALSPSREPLERNFFGNIEENGRMDRGDPG